MSFTDATHGWVVGGSIVTNVSAPPACPAAPVTVLPASLTPPRTLASGAWDIPALCSCGAIPTVLDAVIIDAAHTVTLPSTILPKPKAWTCVDKSSTTPMLPYKWGRSKSGV